MPGASSTYAKHCQSVDIDFHWQILTHNPLIATLLECYSYPLIPPPLKKNQNTDFLRITSHTGTGGVHVCEGNSLIVCMPARGENELYGSRGLRSPVDGATASAVLLAAIGKSIYHAHLPAKPRGAQRIRIRMPFHMHMQNMYLEKDTSNSRDTK
jgi:hypothetical protein